MRNESSITLNEFKEQIVQQIKAKAPSSNVSTEKVTIRVKLSEDSEPIPFYSLKVIIDA